MGIDSIASQMEHGMASHLKRQKQSFSGAVMEHTI
jgi:hypothetical protein